MSGTRFTDKYLHAKVNPSRGYSTSYAPYLPPRKASIPATPPTPSHSPPRKVVTDFAAFGAPKTASVFGTAVQSTPFSLAGGKAAFAGMRNGRGAVMMDDDDDEEDAMRPVDDDDDDGKQRVELREDSISFDQARRIAMQSAWRGAAAGTR